MPATEVARVLLVSIGYPPLDGGVATSTHRVARNLCLLGCEILVLTFDYKTALSGDDCVVLEKDGAVEIRRFGPFYRHHDIDDKEIAEARRRVYDQMEIAAKGFRPTVVLSFYAANAGLLGAYLANALGVPHVVGVRGDDVGRNVFSTKWLPTLRIILDLSTRIVCVNEHLRARLLLAFPNMADRTSVIMNGLELPVGFEPRKSRNYLRGATDWREGCPVAVFIGNPREKKGIRPLLRAVESLGLDSELRVLIVGPTLKECDRNDCGEIWDRLISSSRLHVTGQVDRRSALQIAAEGDMIIMPSVDDGLANGLLEGMALGLCPIASDIFSDIVKSEACGWVFRRGDSNALAAALVAAIENTARRCSLASMAKRRIAEHHAPQKEAESYLRLFKGLYGHAIKNGKMKRES